MTTRRSLAQRIIQARQHGVPSIIANFSRLMSASGEAIHPLLLIATNDVLNDDYREHATAYISWAARPLVAEAIAIKWGATFGARDNDQIMARAYGEMVGTSVVRHKNTLDDVITARLKLVNTLQQCPPQANEIRSLVTEIIRQCRQTGGDLAPAEDCALIIPGRVVVSMQTLTFYSLSGHTLPRDMFENENARDSWAALGSLDFPDVDLEDVDFAISAHYADVWRGSNEASILGYYEGKAQQNLEKVRGMIGGAVFCYLASMTKESNITQAWVHRRRVQFQDRIPGVNFETYITEGIVKQFARMYLPMDAEWEDVYQRLVVCWSMLQVPEGLSLTWIIEQGSNSNVTSITTIADVTAKLQYFDCELLLNKGMPESCFVSVMLQARDLLRNPFCSVVRPTVSIRQYADLAYLCSYMKKELFKDQAFSGYRGQSATMCTMSEADLKLLATLIFNITRERTSSDMDVHDLYLKSRGDNRKHYKVIGNQVFYLPPIVAGQGDQGDDDAELTQAEKRIQKDETLRITRAAWPKNAQALPARTVMISVSEIHAALDESLTDRAKAFNLVMKRLFALQTQVPLTPMPPSAVNYPRPERQIAADIKAALLKWQVVTPEAWSEAVPEYAPGALAGDLYMNRVNIQPRASQNPVVVPEDAAEPDANEAPEPNNEDE